MLRTATRGLAIRVDGDQHDTMRLAHIGAVRPVFGLILDFLVAFAPLGVTLQAYGTICHAHVGEETIELQAAIGVRVDQPLWRHTVFGLEAGAQDACGAPLPAIDQI